MWAPNLPAWIAERTVYAVEILGEAGLSVQERPIRNPEDQASWLAATLAALGLDRAHLVGVSFGGWQAVNLALHDSTAVSSLSLIDPAWALPAEAAARIVGDPARGPGVSAHAHADLDLWWRAGR